MSKDSIVVVWVDDDFDNPQGDREKLAQSFEKGSNGALAIHGLHPSKFLTWLEEVEEGSVKIPDIILLDLFLPNADADGQKAAKSLNLGTKLAGYIRANPSLADIPCYLVSRGFEPEEAGRQTEQFDWILSNQEFSDKGAEILISDANDYRQLRSALSKGNDIAFEGGSAAETATGNIVNLLAPPDPSYRTVYDYVDKLTTELFAIDFSGIGDIELDGMEAHDVRHTTRKAGRWIRSVLLARPGPVVNELLAGVLTGSNLQAFHSKVRTRLENDHPTAYYSGIFSRQATHLLWKDALLEWCLESFDGLPSLPQKKFAEEVAARLDLHTTERARCRVCNDLWPDTIAFDKDDKNEWRQVHISCSKALKESRPFIGFDPLREFDAD